MTNSNSQNTNAGLCPRIPSDLPVAILAGGLATRMRPHTVRVPKALLDVLGEPFIAHQLRGLAANGIRRAVLCTGYLGHKVRDVVGNGRQFGLHVDWSEDGERLLGTAGALRKALPLLGDAFYVLYGDSYLTCDFQAVGRAFLESFRKGLMTVFRNDGLFDKSNVLYEDGRILVYDKQASSPAMRHIDYGLGVLSASVLGNLPADQPADLAAVYQNLLAQGELASHEVAHRFYEIGSPEGWDETVEYLRSQTRTKRISA